MLIGMMGVGKTSLGRRLAPVLDLNFKDADAEIEHAAGMSVSELFARHGEESFRRGEALVMQRLLREPPMVLASGGGALLNPDTRALVAERALSVWVRADVDTILRRAAKRNTRPLLHGDNPRATIEQLLEQRKPIYETADIVIDSQPGPHKRTVKMIAEALMRHPKAELAP